MGALPEVACDILKDSDKEKVAVEMICVKQSKVPADECEAGLSKIWEVVSEKECAKEFKALPEVACDILKDSDQEKAAVEMACEKQSKVPADECAAGLSKIWELIAEKECPKEKFSALPGVACDILKDSGKEKTAVEMVCEKQLKVPKDECEAGLSKIWEMITAKECPKTLKEKFAAKKEKFVGKFFALKEKFVGKISALKEKFSAKKEKKEVQTMFV